MEENMTENHGFKLLKEQRIEEYNADARLYGHVKTGAELLSISSKDENKVFGITFRTPPSDSTGIAHILEHSVLCGSRKYPVKEPFVELLKGSLHSFLNAFTYPDKTCYPVASQNLKDFYNLVDVYLDAVFFPRLTPFVFQQEGWHFEADAPDRAFTFKGVVFNEMKGAYSSPDSLLSEYSIQALFPDNPYGYDSGGNPKHIPNLTYEAFKAFHEKHYHPSNARLYFYGDDDPEERLKLTNAYLKKFHALKLDTTIALQKPFKSPKRTVRSFMIGEEENANAKGMITVNWLLPETKNVQVNFALRVLEYILLGMPASPLRKALIDSGLGEDLAGEGLGTELRQIYFSTGLKGIEADHAEQVETLILDCLKNLSKKGIDPRTIEAALNTIEFRLRENNTGSFPRGLSLMLRALTTWLYDEDPLLMLAFEKPMEKIKSQAESGKGFFENMIAQFLVKNPHRHTLILKPDNELREKQAAAEKSRLDRTRAGMSKKEIESVVRNTQALKQKQETPDPPEALATIPVLSLSDLAKKNIKIPASLSDHDETEILFHDLFSNGIVYLDLGFDLHALPGEYLPYVPLFGRALVEMGTEKEDFVALTQRISRKTGGIHPQTFTSTVRGKGPSTAWIFLRCKAMRDQTEALMHILYDVLSSARFDNKARFHQMLLEEKARVEEMLVPKGHQVVNLRLRAHFGEAMGAAEQMNGISYLFFLRQLAERIDGDWPKVLQVLENMRRRLLNRKRAIVNVTVDEPNWILFEPQVKDLLNALPQNDDHAETWSLETPRPFEGMTIPSQINYVGKGANLYDLGYRFHGSALVITRYLRNGWLWDRVRVQGGAYGAFCNLDRLSGVLTFVSYRDPNLMGTLEVFDNTARYLRDLSLSREELNKAVIGAIGDLDAHMLPDAKGYVSLLRHLNGDDDDLRQKMREEILHTNGSHFKAFADILSLVKQKGIVKILGSPAALEDVKKAHPGWLEIFSVL